MSNTIYNANFWELLTRYQIEIPIIQRDYVQGRNENVKIKRKIVSKFKEALEGNPTKLDFIYGNIKSDVFYPLDGQQRLTTLFLYYLYFAMRDGKLRDEKIKSIFDKFTYSTRISSKEFFKKILESDIHIDKNSHLSKVITNQSWFILYWKNDPTVLSALNMLDEIHSQCYVSNIVFDDLITNEGKNITFEFLELEKFGLSDDLYIKMNARGKTLSAFENFKADLISFIKSKGWESNVVYQDRFSTKLDGKWTDYFWDEGKNSSIFDIFFINFFHQFLITEVATRGELSSQIINNYFSDELEDNHQNKITIDELLTNILSSIDNIPITFLDEQTFTNLCNQLEKFSSISRDLKLDSSLRIHDFDCIDNMISSGRITYPNRVYHFAHSLYLVNNDLLDNVAYNKWMRVVRNIISNSTIDTIETFRGALQLINELGKGSNDIYEFLSNNSIKSRFAEKQIKEEIRKSKLLVENIIKYQDLIDIEDRKLCQGRIEFVLDFIDSKLNADYSKLNRVTEVFKNNFEKNDFGNDIRALFLTCGNNKFYDYWSSWVYIVDLPKRCLIENTNDLRNYSYNKNYRHYFNDLLEKMILNENIDYLLEIFKNSAFYLNLPKWKQEIINNYKILDNNCKSKMIAVSDDDSKCYLMNVGKPRSKESMKLIN